MQIATTILEATSDVGREGIKPTNLMRKSNIPYNRFTPFLKKLVANDLINEIEVKGRHTYVITEKGRMYLEEYKRFADLAESFGMEL